MGGGSTDYELVTVTMESRMGIPLSLYACILQGGKVQFVKYTKNENMPGVYGWTEQAEE